MSDTALLVVGIGLFLASAFFVSAEYALVSSRKSRLEGMAKRGSAAAKLAVEALRQQSRYVAGTQIAITFLGIAVGAILEPAMTAKIAPIFPRQFPPAVAGVVALVIVSYPLVVLGELVPKYIALKFPDRLIMAFAPALTAVVLVLQPLIWLFQTSGMLVLRLLRLDYHPTHALTKEELSVLIRESQGEGGLDEPQAEVMTRALRLDSLDANDIMVHRLDIKWMDMKLTADEVMARLSETPHSRIPVCHGDIDEIAGIAYLQDIVKHIGNPRFTLEWVVRPAEFVPENLTLDKIVARMREVKTQILIVRDEYGGTSGLVTLEDVVEEIFGEMDDTLESERPPIERTSTFRLSARGDVRYDELLAFLGEKPTDETPTETLATLVVDQVDRVPRLGDTVDTPIGKLRVDQITRHRIRRLGVYLNRKRPTPQETGVRPR